MAVTESTDTLSIQAATRPDDLAVFVDPSGGAVASSTTFAELEALANQLAHGWRALGIEAGERLVWCGPNSLEVIAAIHGARKAALVSVPLSYRFIADEMQYVVDNAEAGVVMIDAEQAPTLAHVMDRLPTVRKVVVFGGPVPEGSGFSHWDDLIAGQPITEMDAPAANSLGATMVYTSGTTGKPKGAMRSSSDKGIVGAMMLRLGLLEGEHRHLTTGPLYHSGPLSFAALNHSIGAPIYVLRKFDPIAWLRIVREHRITNTFTAPTQLKRIVSLPPEELAKADLSSMRCLIANAAPVPYALKQEVIAKLGDGFLFEVYGSTELGVATILGPEDQLRKPGSCGQTYGGVQVRIVKDDGEDAAPGEPGELFISTGLGMDGYHHTEETLTELTGTEWRSVGDVAYVDDEGYVHICDRKKDMIISGGVNIYPAEIEAVIHGHPQILDAAVFGIPDEEWGERVHAIVQAKAGEDLDLEELREFVNARLAGYMRPRAYEIRDELPRTDAGKLLKRVLRDEYWQGRASAV